MLTNSAGIVVCYLVDQTEALVAGPVIGVLADATIETGGGFGIYQGGVQTTSSRLPGLSEEERNAVWKECRDWREDHTDYLHNTEVEKKLLLAGSTPPGKGWIEEMEEKLEQERIIHEAEMDAKEAYVKSRDAKYLEGLEKDLREVENVVYNDQNSRWDWKGQHKKLFEALESLAQEAQQELEKAKGSD